MYSPSYISILFLIFIFISILQAVTTNYSLFLSAKIITSYSYFSCSEIFIAAVTETTDIPLVGSTTYGKGIGQSMFLTYNGGLATITDIEFLTPKGNSYHKVGIVPKYPCENGINSNDCAARVASELYNVKIPEQDQNILAKQSSRQIEDYPNPEFEGGAIEWGNLF